MSLITTKPVLVTGASGFVANYTIQTLLSKGYHVRGTVRSLEDASTKYAHLYAMDKDTPDSKANGRLELVGGCNLTEEGSFDAAVVGCEYVMHIASPYTMAVKDPQTDLVDPALQGTLNLLNAVKKAGGVKRVVLTSSCAAILDEGEDKKKVFTEADWNDKSSLTRLPYYYSKVVAEKAAWAFMDEWKKETPELETDLVVMNPFVVLGRDMGPTPQMSNVNASTQTLCRLLNGDFPVYLDIDFAIVDVRDVGDAHVFAMETKECEGRNIVVTTPSWSLKRLSAFLREKFPAYAKNIPTKGIWNWVACLASYSEGKFVGQFLRNFLGHTVTMNNEKLTKQGFKYRPAEETLQWVCEWLMSENIVKAP